LFIHFSLSSLAPFLSQAATLPPLFLSLARAASQQHHGLCYEIGIGKFSLVVAKLHLSCSVAVAMGNKFGVFYWMPAILGYLIWGSRV
jgi:hypothetical protein